MTWPAVEEPPAISGMTGQAQPRRRWWSQPMLAPSIVTAALIVAAVAATVARRPSLPAPTGTFAVGTVAGGMASRARDAVGVDAIIAVRAWYPARSGNPGTPAKGSQAIRWHGISFHKGYATAAMEGAPVAGDGPRLPLVLYVPSWSGGKTEATALAQEVASHGFVVVALDPVAAPLDRREMDFSSPEAGAATLRYADTLVVAQAHDASSLLDRLMQPGDQGPLAEVVDRIDFRRVGIMGFSFGGAVAAQACWTDPRFRAALDMDGWLFGDAALNGISQPFMVMSDDTPLPGEADLRSSNAERRLVAELNLADDGRMVASMERHGGTRVTVTGARHANFTDAPLTWPIARMTGAGPAAPADVFRVVAAYAVAFLDKSFRGGDPAVLQLNSPALPGSRIERWATPGAAK